MGEIRVRTGSSEQELALLRDIGEIWARYGRDMGEIGARTGSSAQELDLPRDIGEIWGKKRPSRPLPGAAPLPRPFYPGPPALSLAPLPWPYHPDRVLMQLSFRTHGTGGTGEVVSSASRSRPAGPCPQQHDSSRCADGTGVPSAARDTDSTSGIAVRCWVTSGLSSCWVTSGLAYLQHEMLHPRGTRRSDGRPIAAKGTIQRAVKCKPLDGGTPHQAENVAVLYVI